MKKIIKKVPKDYSKNIFLNNGISEEKVRMLGTRYSLPNEFIIVDVEKEFIEQNIDGNTVKIPSFKLADGSTMPINSLFASYTTRDKAQPLKKDKTKFLVVNNKKVYSFAEGKTIFEFADWCVGKKFKCGESKDLPVFSVEYIDREPQYPTSEALALEMIKPKSYRVCSLVGEVTEYESNEEQLSE